MTTWEIIKYVLLYIVMGAGVFALVGLGMFLVNLAKTVKSAKTILDDNKPAIDHSLSVLPEVVENVSDITYSVGEITEKSKPEIATILSNVSSVTNDVSHVTGTAKDATDSVAYGIKQVASGLEEVGNKTKETAENVSTLFQRGVNGVKYNFFETKKDVLSRIISTVDSIKNLF